MNITKEQWQKIVSILISAAIAIAAVLGWQIGIQPLLFPGSEGYGVRAVRERIGLDSNVDSYFYNGADLYFYSDHHSTQKVKVDGGTGAITAQSITLGSGSQAISSTKMMTLTVTNNTLVAHGMTGTPRVACTPYMLGLFTYTVYISASNATSLTFGISDPNVPGAAVNSVPVSLNCVMGIP